MDVETQGRDLTRSSTTPDSHETGAKHEAEAEGAMDATETGLLYNNETPSVTLSATKREEDATDATKREEDATDATKREEDATETGLLYNNETPSVTLSAVETRSAKAVKYQQYHESLKASVQAFSKEARQKKGSVNEEARWLNEASKDRANRHVMSLNIDHAFDPDEFDAYFADGGTVFSGAPDRLPRPIGEDADLEARLKEGDVSVPPALLPTADELEQPHDEQPQGPKDEKEKEEPKDEDEDEEKESTALLPTAGEQPHGPEDEEGRKEHYNVIGFKKCMYYQNAKALLEERSSKGECTFKVFEKKDLAEYHAYLKEKNGHKRMLMRHWEETDPAVHKRIEEQTSSPMVWTTASPESETPLEFVGGFDDLEVRLDPPKERPK